MRPAVKTGLPGVSKGPGCLNSVPRNLCLKRQGWQASRTVVFLFQYMVPDKRSGPELATLPADKVVDEL